MHLLRSLREFASENQYRHLPGLRLQCGSLCLRVYHSDEKELVRWAARGWNSVPAQAELAEAKVQNGELYLYPKQPGMNGEVEKLVPTKRDKWMGPFAAGLQRLVGA